MAVQRARTGEEYADWMKQAKFEVEELRQCIEFEMDEMARMPAWLGQLEEGVNKVYDDMLGARYTFGREDLPFMELAERFADDIPFIMLLRQINETHRRGLDVGEED